MFTKLSDTHQRACQWILGHDVGTSSSTIWQVMMGVEENPSADIPYDLGDFRRCIKLVREMPEWSAHLHLVSEAYPEWGPIIDAWNDITYWVECAEARPYGIGASDDLAIARDILKDAVREAKEIQRQIHIEREHREHFEYLFGEIEDGKLIRYVVNEIKVHTCITEQSIDRLIEDVNVKMMLVGFVDEDGNEVDEDHPDRIPNFTTKFISNRYT